MKIDDFDQTLVCDENDFLTVLSYFKDYRILPDYVEIAILKVILRQFNIIPQDSKTVDDYFKLIPKQYTNKIINNLNVMFDTKMKAEYSNRYLSYLIYYLPANVFKIWKPLLDLQLKNLLKPHIRVLDVGTGPGSIPIGIIEYYRTLAESFPEISFSLSFTLIDAEEEFLKIANEMITMVKTVNTQNLEICVENLLCEKVDVKSKFTDLKNFDIITMSNFLHVNEGENYKNAVQIINTFKKHMEEVGSLIVIQPGDQLSSVSLKKIRNEVVNNNTLNVFSPCIGLWEEKNRYNCQCFSMVKCFWEIPRIYDYLVNMGLNKTRRKGIPFNYVIFRKDNTKKYEITKNSQHYVKLAELKQYVNQIVNVKALIRTVIQIGNKFNIALCDGSCEFSENRKAVWVSISEKQLQYFGINIPLIAAEKITLKRVMVNLVGEKISLKVEKNTRMTIEY